MNNLTHFELPALDIERAHKFYAGLFDWDFQKIPDMNYLFFQLKNADGNNAGSGGIFEKKEGMDKITNYINVVNIDDSAAKVTELGGKIIIPKAPVPGMGWFVQFVDTEGNIMALWQMDLEAK